MPQDSILHQNSILSDLLSLVAKEDGSILHMRTGAIPKVLQDEFLREVPGVTPLTEEQAEYIVAALTTPQERKDFYRGADIYVKYELPGVEKFRGYIYLSSGVFTATLKVDS